MVWGESVGTRANQILRQQPRTDLQLLRSLIARRTGRLEAERHMGVQAVAHTLSVRLTCASVIRFQIHLSKRDGSRLDQPQRA